MREEEIALLEQFFYINRTKRKDAVYEASAVELLEKTKMDEFVAVFGSSIKALEPAASAAYIAAYFAGVGLALQVSASVYGHAPHLPLSNLTFEIVPQAGRYLISFRIRKWLAEPIPDYEEECARTNWLLEKFSDFYMNSMRPLFETLSHSVGIDIGQLWGQLPTKFNYYIGLLSEDPRFEPVRARLESDYRLLKNELDPSVFGRNRNPFEVKVTMIESLLDPEKQVRIKNVCCLYYRTEGGRYCYTCPRLKAKDRADRRAVARVEQPAATSK